MHVTMHNPNPSLRDACTQTSSGNVGASTDAGMLGRWAQVVLGNAGHSCAGPALSCSTMAAVAVAMPLMRCAKLRAIRSAIRMERALPFTVPNLVPELTRSPSLAVHVTDKLGSTVENTYASICLVNIHHLRVIE